jgi:hypothetical protein
MTIKLRETEVDALMQKRFLNEEARNNLSPVKSAFNGFPKWHIKFVTRNGGQHAPSRSLTYHSPSMRLWESESSRNSVESNAWNQGLWQCNEKP